MTETENAIQAGRAPALRPSRRTARRRETRPRARAASFVLVRVTGLALTVLVLGHFALTHIVHDVADTNSTFVARRWGSALWVAWDGLMLASAIAHGAAGVWIAIDDYTPDPVKRGRRRAVLLSLSGLALALGTIAIAAAEW